MGDISSKPGNQDGPSRAARISPCVAGLRSAAAGKPRITSRLRRRSRTMAQHRSAVEGRRLTVFDCRTEASERPDRELSIAGEDLDTFLRAVSREFSIAEGEAFVLATTDRKQINASRFEELKDGSTLYLLHSVDQELHVATKEPIMFLPHYDTLIKSGMYEYYASEGQKSLPYAFAELIDNALSATVKNTGVRNIEIRLLFDDIQGKPAVVILDNGSGMTSKQLNNWAVYRLSKFSRENSDFQSDHTGYIRPLPVPRSLNSDISYFGVGGKQAVFYIGQSARMITRPVGSPDVHELVLSKEEFEKKERNREEIYCGFIRNRKPGDSSHIDSEDERFLHNLIQEEVQKDSFTAVVITGVQPEHIAFLRSDFQVWTRELAHIYHYYIHGAQGNDSASLLRTSDIITKIDIQICLLEKSKTPRMLNLRLVSNDMQTLYINSCVDTFEFRAHVEGDGIVEGLIRYHPFLYDKETYPEDPYSLSNAAEEEDEDCVIFNQEGRGKRPIFQCFWNGRLIPYTTVAEFDWCARPKKSGSVPLECLNRISGVLFTNDHFQVSTNKLTFMDLELQLKDKETIFTRVVNGQEQRVKIQKEFSQWLKECHEKWDKQVKFLGFQGIMARMDVSTKKMQSPWAKFSSIEWDGKTYSTGQYVKTVKTHPIIFGSIMQFLLYGDHEGDVYATGGHVQLAVEPKQLFDEVKTIPISKLDRAANLKSIKKYIDDELAKLPDKLRVTWPEGNEWTPNDVRAAGTPFGPIQVEILNKKGESMTRMPGTNLSSSKKLLMELKVFWHSPTGDIETNSHISQHGGKWPYWFKTMENLSKLGSYTLHLQAVLNESSASIFAGQKLPSYRMKFSICAGSAQKFTLGAVSTPFRVAVPFSVPVEFLDEFGQHAKPPADIKPLLECSGLDLSCDGTSVNGNTFTIKGVKASGPVKNFQGKGYSVKVIMPGMKPETQLLKINLLPGLPSYLKVKPDTVKMEVENGTCQEFRVEVHDEAGNITAHPKLIVRCQFTGTTELPLEALDCSNTGTGLFKSKLYIKNVKADLMITAKFDIPSCKNVKTVEQVLKVTPSRQVARLEIFSQQEDGSIIALKDGEKVGWTAGDILQDLHFQMFDEADRAVPLTPSLARKIKVNWQASCKELDQGKLPNIPVPTVAKEEHYYQVSLQDETSSVTCSFTIMPRPDEPKRMKATWKSIASVRMGELLPVDICLEVVDQFGNKTPTLTSACVNSFGVSADGLDKTSLKVTWQESSQSIVIQGVRFLPGAPGPRELCFAWREFAECVRLNVLPGPPKLLSLLDKPEEPLQVFSGNSIERPLVVQICDEWGSPSPEPDAIISLKATSSDLSITLVPPAQAGDWEGKASFLVKNVTAAKGEYSLEFSGALGKQSIPGPVVKLKVVPDPNRPVKLTVNYDTASEFRAGGFFPVFSVTVLSEDGGAIRNLSPASISMLMWKGESMGPRPPSGAAALKCSKPKETEKDDCFYFRDKIIPDRIGKYTIQFVVCVDKTKCLWSHQYVMNVVPSIPEKLMPDFQPPTPVVSNIREVESRTLVKSLSLKIMDEYSNPAGAHLNGTVQVSLRGPATGMVELPVFEGKVRSKSFQLSGGMAEIKDLVILENSPGTDGMEYILVFQPLVRGLPTDSVLKSFELPFMFYNDSKNQQQMATLTQKKDRLSQSIIAYRSLFDTNNQLISELKDQLQDATNKEDYLKSELKKIDINPTLVSTVEAIDVLISQKKAEQERLLKQPRRVCSIPEAFRSNPDVLGKVAHLAQIVDMDVARVLSWHLSGDMDCVVTLTTAAARQIYDDTQGRQQVLPLDSVFWKNSNRPLPHIRNGVCTFIPQGNPMFARDLFIFPKNAESCQIVFGNLLGDTILVDSLDAANHYRKGVVQSKMQCPTLLTRHGERVRSNGKFGGLQNKAPPIEKLRGQVFAAPPPQQYYTLCGEIDLLQQYRMAMVKSQETREEYECHLEHLRSPEMVQKEQELKEQEQQLKDIETTLGMSMSRKSKGPGTKRSSQGDGSDMNPKRLRRDSRSSVSESSHSMGTRRRTS
ncbi:structural maintenance of chromosomes flexible hinge domain-containing protein 1 isoform X1 [Paramormyrops kingsleyae]|uniref:structural maintenance of chromosomes flexible hinge domain-containing protein 1 isoform X1 n=1 Tax=Paramormyrops kingsleyae TaxID=1676925 RepID=UPI003B977390